MLILFISSLCEAERVWSPGLILNTVWNRGDECVCMQLSHERNTGKAEVSSRPRLHSEFEAGLWYTDSCLQGFRLFKVICWRPNSYSSFPEHSAKVNPAVCIKTYWSCICSIMNSICLYSFEGWPLWVISACILVQSITLKIPNPWKYHFLHTRKFLS